MTLDPTRCAAAILAALTLACPPAASAGGDEHQLNVMLHWTGATEHGLGGGVGYTYGIDDWWNVMVEVDWSALFASGEGAGVLQVGQVSAGVVYNIDAFQWVPYLRLSVGGFMALPDAGDPAGDFGISVGGGVDYRPARRWAVGVWGAYHILVLGNITGLGAAGLRVNLYY